MTKIKYTFLPKKKIAVSIEDTDTHKVLLEETRSFTRAPDFHAIAELTPTYLLLSHAYNVEIECVDQTVT